MKPIDIHISASNSDQIPITFSYLPTKHSTKFNPSNAKSAQGQVSTCPPPVDLTTDAGSRLRQYLTLRPTATKTTAETTRRKRTALLPTHTRRLVRRPPSPPRVHPPTNKSINTNLILFVTFINLIYRKSYRNSCSININQRATASAPTTTLQCSTVFSARGAELHTAETHCCCRVASLFFESPFGVPPRYWLFLVGTHTSKEQKRRRKTSTAKSVDSTSKQPCNRVRGVRWMCGTSSHESLEVKKNSRPDGRRWHNTKPIRNEERKIIIQ